MTETRMRRTMSASKMRFFQGSLVLVAMALLGCGSSEKPAPRVADTPKVADAAPPPDEPETPIAVAAEEWKTLIDLDARPPKPAVSKPESYAKYAEPSYKAYRKSKKECTWKNDAVLGVDGGLAGAFTKKDAVEQLYLVSLYPCDEKSGGTHTLVVLQGNRAVAKAEVPEHELVLVRDVDQDGDNEILLVGGWAPQVKARLVTFEDGKLQTLFDFGELARGSCENGSPSGESAVIRYRRGANSMEYRAERKPKTCAR